MSIPLNILLSIVGFCTAQNSSPAVLPPVRVHGEIGSCPSEALDRVRNDANQEILEILHQRSLLLYGPCGGPGEWRKIAQLNMSDPNQQCPNNLNLITDPVRACGQTTGAGTACDSVIFSTNNQPYSRVCGRVRAYLRRDTFGFWTYIFGGATTLDSAYLDGFSLTHGAAGSRQHIWSFVATTRGLTEPSYNCPCSIINTTWPYQLPPFIGDNYFCDTGYGSYDENVFFLNDHLWDGDGCGFSSTCCQFNTPPWFSTTLPQSTTDDIELRACNWAEPERGDVYLDLLELYVQ